ncbi:IS5 family transposase [Acidovorax sp. SUPP3334]|uniref:IS5 family transposase n=1 Tax=Acidovorax sp. SUPP3334 TaxID=2920881 RepID=UPI0023DE2F8F|nr:IS5 family transposase [Acidovorax sp. SUPP3334]GKT20265.1 IS5-like element ISAte1 family transposase [Acidovorax sp. SUPP3334]
MSEPRQPKTRYKTTNWTEYNAALKARGSLTIWLDKDMQWYASTSGKRGRHHTFTDAAIQFCLSIKCLFGLALRQSLGLIQSLLELAKLNWRVPDFSTLSRRQRTLQVQLPYRRSSTALDLLVDSTGIKFLGEGEWKCKKHGAEYRRQWRKVHLGIDASTLEIRAIEVTDNSVGEAPMLPGLLAQIPPDEPIASVSTDGAYDTKDCHAAIAQRGAQAVIPPRKNGKPWKETRQGAAVRNEALRACKRLGRGIWKQCSGYHRRSLVETKMHCFKRLGERVMARTFERQVVELHVRVALLNRFTQLGCPTTVPVSVPAVA